MDGIEAVCLLPLCCPVRFPLTRRPCDRFPTCRKLIALSASMPP